MGIKLKQVDCVFWSADEYGIGSCEIFEFVNPTTKSCNEICPKKTPHNSEDIDARRKLFLSTAPQRPEIIELQNRALVESVKNGNMSKKPECSSCAKKGLKQFLVGGAKILKAELGMDACEETIMSDRKTTCESCAEYDFGVCNKCGCFCAVKIKLKSEKCPEGKW